MVCLLVYWSAVFMLVFLCVFWSVCVYFGPSVCLLVRQFMLAFLCVCWSVCMSVYLLVCLCVSWSVRVYFCLSVCLLVSLTCYTYNWNSKDLELADCWIGIKKIFKKTYWPKFNIWIHIHRISFSKKSLEPNYHFLSMLAEKKRIIRQRKLFGNIILI